MKLDDTPLITAREIEHKVGELAKRISDDFAGKDLLVIVVLKGGLFFAADLLRCMSIPATLDFIRARSYCETRSTGQIEFTYVPETSITDKHVLVVEDILDTGRTASAILERIRYERPASLAVCALLDKPSRRENPISADYVGFVIDDHFVVGYGLDYEQRGRELPDIRILQDEED